MIKSLSITFYIYLSYTFINLEKEIYININSLIAEKGEGVRVAAHRRISKFASRRTQIFLKQCRRPQILYLLEP